MRRPWRPDMPAVLPPSTIGRCSASSRSFLLGPDGPAGAPPGQGLRSGALIELRANREQKQDPYYKVSTVSGEPRADYVAWSARLAFPRLRTAKSEPPWLISITTTAPSAAEANS